MKKNTKVISTIGPSSSSEKTLSDFFICGCYATRFNFSHGDHKEQLKKVQLVKEVGIKKGAPFTLILDTKGPEIRTHEFDGPAEIEKGSFVKIYCKVNILGNSNQFSVSLESFASDVKKGDLILVDDGKLQMICENVIHDVVTARALNSHILTSRRGVNLPNTKLSLKFLSDKDKKDLVFGCENNFNWVAASFVSSADDVSEIRNFLDKNGGQEIRIIAKIESEEALTNIKSIIKISDAIMVARGDLGIEIPYYLVPYWTLRILQYCRNEEKPVIVATQMLESMTSNISPTRAEVSDVYYASYFGADSTMLSGESAKGNFPVDTVKVMSRILKEENDNSSTSTKSNIKVNAPQTVRGIPISEFIYYDAVAILSDDYDLVRMLASLREKFLIIIVKDIKNFTNDYGFIYSTYVIYKKGKFIDVDHKFIKEEVKRIYDMDIWNVKIIH